MHVSDATNCELSSSSTSLKMSLSRSNDLKTVFLTIRKNTFPGALRDSDSLEIHKTE